MNSKRKGNSYENYICKILSSWWGEKFSRVPNSGGLESLISKQIVGDIIVPSSFPFVVECKKQEGWSFEQILEGKSKFFKWWNQVVRDSKKVDKFPLLIFSKNYSKDYLATYEKNIIKFINRNDNIIKIGEIIIGGLALMTRIDKKDFLAKIWGIDD